MNLGKVNSLLYHLALVFFNLLMRPELEVELISGDEDDDKEAEGVTTSGAGDTDVEVISGASDDSCASYSKSLRTCGFAKIILNDFTVLPKRVSCSTPSGALVMALVMAAGTRNGAYKYASRSFAQLLIASRLTIAAKTGVFFVVSSSLTLLYLLLLP